MKSGASGRAINLNHSTYHYDVDDYREDVEQELYDKGLQKYGKQGSQLHSFQRRLHVGKIRSVDRYSTRYDSSTLRYDMLRNIKNGHRDVKCMRDQFHRHEGLKHPLKEDPGFKVRKIIMRNDELNKLIASDKCQDDSCNRHDHVL